MGIEDRAMDVGTRVQVRNRFLAEFRPGFEIAEVTQSGGYVLRRLSDGVQLPAPFAPDEVLPDLNR